MRQANKVKEYKQQLQEAKAENERLDALHHEHKVLSAYLSRSFFVFSSFSCPAWISQLAQHAGLPAGVADATISNVTGD
jgi:hypothetical protein